MVQAPKPKAIERSPENAAALQALASTSRSVTIGSRVEACGFKTARFAVMNGKAGVVLRHQPPIHWVVNFDNPEIGEKALEMVNLRVLEQMPMQPQTQEELDKGLPKIPCPGCKGMINVLPGRCEQKCACGLVLDIDASEAFPTPKCIGPSKVVTSPTLLNAGRGGQVGVVAPQPAFRPPPRQRPPGIYKPPTLNTGITPLGALPADPAAPHLPSLDPTHYSGGVVPARAFIQRSLAEKKFAEKQGPSYGPQMKMIGGPTSAPQTEGPALGPQAQELPGGAALPPLAAEVEEDDPFAPKPAAEEEGVGEDDPFAARGPSEEAEEGGPGGSGAAAAFEAGGDEFPCPTCGAPMQTPPATEEGGVAVVRCNACNTDLEVEVEKLPPGFNTGLQTAKPVALQDLVGDGPRGPSPHPDSVWDGSGGWSCGCGWVNLAHFNNKVCHRCKKGAPAEGVVGLGDGVTTQAKGGKLSWREHQMAWRDIDSKGTWCGSERGKFRGRMCKYWEQNGKCLEGDQCSYAHSKDELMLQGGPRFGGSGSLGIGDVIGDERPMAPRGGRKLIEDTTPKSHFRVRVSGHPPGTDATQLCDALKAVCRAHTLEHPDGAKSCETSAAHGAPDACVLCFASEECAEEVASHFGTFADEDGHPQDWRLKSLSTKIAQLSFVYLGPFDDDAPLLPPEEQNVNLKRSVGGEDGEKWGFTVSDDLVVTSVQKNSPAGRASLSPGSVILRAQGDTVVVPADAFGDPFDARVTELLLTVRPPGRAPAAAKVNAEEYGALVAKYQDEIAEGEKMVQEQLKADRERRKREADKGRGTWRCEQCNDLIDVTLTTCFSCKVGGRGLVPRPDELSSIAAEVARKRRESGWEGYANGDAAAKEEEEADGGEGAAFVGDIPAPSGGSRFAGKRERAGSSSSSASSEDEEYKRFMRAKEKERERKEMQDQEKAPVMTEEEKAKQKEKRAREKSAERKRQAEEELELGRKQQKEREAEKAKAASAPPANETWLEKELRLRAEERVKKQQREIERAHEKEKEREEREKEREEKEKKQRSKEEERKLEKEKEREKEKQKEWREKARKRAREQQEEQDRKEAEARAQQLKDRERANNKGRQEAAAVAPEDKKKRKRQLVDELNKWKAGFEDEAGRKPTKNDIISDKKMGPLYAEFMVLKEEAPKKAAGGGDRDRDRGRDKDAGGGGRKRERSGSRG